MTTHEDLEDLSVERDQLRRALETQPVIEQAKGMFMLLRGWTAEEAFTALTTISQHTNVKLHDVATVIVTAGGHGEQSLQNPETVRVVLAETRGIVLGVTFGG
ncbi:ANTAR domain-containing protein [Amycolatopsis alba]|uniref:ANTAR domain-containing protein n=1 Tax=Amycolatopsis alba DSM 44262 TaxID=1125972 RepID=A0A229R8T0_AMYAL|nr:ANTAR domain-containing protein [Amycolatopsis alba]OXM43070.1 ANTAR domain-containing protein [Amycolatopsis alba DSM 44262]